MGTSSTVEDRVRMRVFRSNLQRRQGRGVDVISSSDRASVNAGQPHALTMAVLPRYQCSSSSWCDKGLLETATRRANMHCRQSTRHRGWRPGGKCGRGWARVQNVWFGLDVLQEEATCTPPARPDRDHRGGVLGCNAKAETKAPSHAGTARYVHVR